MKLPLKCEAEYIKDFLDAESADSLFQSLYSIVEHSSFSIEVAGGQTYTPDYLKIMFVDKNLKEANKFPEQIWGTVSNWTTELRSLKEKIEKHIGQAFQVCVLIYYPDGNTGVDFHSDLVAFGDTTTIPSVSLGEEREFKFREKASREELAITLAHGSVVIMGKHCQERYDHSLSINPMYKKPRINLTFRKYGFGG